MNPIVKTEVEYEDLLGLWSDLEAGLAVVLTHPDSVQEFEQRIRQYGRWLQDLLRQDTNVGLYLLFQLATKSPVGYSASHALVCGVLCDLIARDFGLPQARRDSLVQAALTMNVSMTVLQDNLVTQRDRPSPEQQLLIGDHAAKSTAILASKGIADALWLEVVGHHHLGSASKAPFNQLAPPDQLADILHMVDRYAAMISPRVSREGKSAADSARKLLRDRSGQSGTIGQALVHMVGLFPPGTFVELEDGRVAIVTCRTKHLDQPDVAVVMDQQGKLLRPPLLHHTTDDGAGIKSALLPSAVQEHINHHLILQLGSSTA